MNRHWRSQALPGVALLLGCHAACGDAADPGRRDSSPEAAAFTEVAGASGVDFRHGSGAAGAFMLPEIMGGGAGFLDYDGDGSLDLYLVQSGRIGSPDEALTNRLYRNDGSGGFGEVTALAGVGDPGWANQDADTQLKRSPMQAVFLPRPPLAPSPPVPQRPPPEPVGDAFERELESRINKGHDRDDRRKRLAEEFGSSRPDELPERQRSSEPPEARATQDRPEPEPDPVSDPVPTDQGDPHTIRVHARGRLRKPEFTCVQAGGAARKQPPSPRKRRRRRRGVNAASRPTGPGRRRTSETTAGRWPAVKSRTGWTHTGPAAITRLCGGCCSLLFGWCPWCLPGPMTIARRTRNTARNWARRPACRKRTCARPSSRAPTSS